MAEVFLIEGKKTLPAGQGSSQSELQIVLKRDRVRGEDRGAARRLDLKVKGSLHKLKLELVVPSPAPWHCWEWQPGKDRELGKDRQQGRTASQG